MTKALSKLSQKTATVAVFVAEISDCSRQCGQPISHKKYEKKAKMLSQVKKVKNILPFS